MARTTKNNPKMMRKMPTGTEATAANIPILRRTIPIMNPIGWSSSSFKKEHKFQKAINGNSSRETLSFSFVSMITTWQDYKKHQIFEQFIFILATQLAIPRWCQFE